MCVLKLVWYFYGKIIYIYIYIYVQSVFFQSTAGIGYSLSVILKEQLAMLAHDVLARGLNLDLFSSNEYST